MAKVVNLNRLRKAHDRATLKVQADANAVKFGRSKAARDLDAARAEAERRKLDALRRE